ncbi:MAG: TIGR02281 family clan AA aspartic protease [Pseudolabrys sp.]
MRSLLVFAALIFLGGGILARYTADEFMSRPPPAAQAKMVQPPQPVGQQSASGYSRRVTLSGDRSGHFRTEAEVDGRRIDFVVDTGASVVVLRESDAFRVGIRPVPRDYSARVSTANGEVKAARATLRRVEIGGITVYDVKAMVLPDEALSTNLLGVSFLSRLKRYEYANGRMVLEQ